MEQNILDPVPQNNVIIIINQLTLSHRHIPSVNNKSYVFVTRSCSLLRSMLTGHAKAKMKRQDA